MEAMLQPVAEFFGPSWTAIWTLLKIVAIIAPLMIAVAYLTLAERKVIGFMQVRIGPNRVGPKGLLQPIADGVKLLFKEIIVPSGANKGLFILGPILAIAPSLAAWAVIPFGDGLVLADVNAGLLFLLAITSMEVYGVIVAGWASNSKYPFLGSMRAAAQSEGRFADMGLGILSWNWLPLFPMFVVYMISGIAETNRAPFDVVEGEAEVVAGHMVEYSGMTFALFFLAEYANMILVSILTSILFLGGWLSPVGFLPDGFHWLALKTAAILFIFLWARATFPRFRYDHIMRLGWKVFIPVTLVWVFVVAVWMMSPLSIWS